MIMRDPYIKPSYLYPHHEVALCTIAAKKLQEQVEQKNETDEGTLVLDFDEFYEEFPENAMTAFLELGIADNELVVRGGPPNVWEAPPEEAERLLQRAKRFLSSSPIGEDPRETPNWEYVKRYQLYHPTRSRHRRASVGEIQRLEKAGYKLFPPREVISQLEGQYDWYDWDFTPGVKGEVQNN